MLKHPRLRTRNEPQQSRARQTRQDILDAAARCLEQEGIDVSMTRIAEDVPEYSEIWLEAGQRLSVEDPRIATCASSSRTCSPTPAAKR